MTEHSEEYRQPTTDALRDRIAAAWSDHETGTLRPEGYVPCRCGQRFTSPQALSRHRASVMLEVLADADPTDLGFKWVDGITYCTFHDATVTAERARTGACDRAHHFCAEVPVYARPRPEETTDG